MANNEQPPLSPYSENQKIKRAYIKNWYKAYTSEYGDGMIILPNLEEEGLGPEKLYGIIEEETESGYLNNYILNLQSNNVVDESDYPQDPTNKIPYSSSNDLTSNLYFNGQQIPVKNSSFTVSLPGLVTNIQTVELYTFVDSSEVTELSNTMHTSWESGNYGAYYFFDETPTTLISFPVPTTYTRENVPLFQIIWRYTTLKGITDYYKNIAYANSIKDFGVELYSSGNWDDNTTPLEGTTSAHIIDFKHSGIHRLYFPVSSGTTISRINATYSKSND